MSVFGHIPFDGFAATDLAVLAAIYFGAFFLKGVFGIGTMPPLVIFGAWVFEPHDAVVLAVLVNAVTQAQFVTAMRRDADWKLARPMVLAFALSIVAGVWIFGRLFQTLSEERFRLYFNAVLMAAAASLVWRGAAAM